ncbi:MAG: aminotransferase class I/II-fold pyridoxal phosphate-dependent enzyme [Gammaproteobacteria bacterium]|nr:aminotransferase class I/II-fold pyridoxal phosphate-dependent enzyme [Gammaproteobacteria bacterium]
MTDEPGRESAILPHRYSRLMVDAMASKRRLFDYLRADGPFMRNKDKPDICDFAFGNPQEMPIPGVAEAIRRAAEPKSKDWFSYMLNWPRGQSVIAENLRTRTGLSYEAEDIVFTNGSFGAISVIIRTLSGPGDEVIFMSPPWFNYESMICAAGSAPVRLRIRETDFDLDLDAVESTVSKKTAIVIVNSPHNPTGKIYPPETLRRLAGILEAASRKFGRRIYLLSDESYNRVVFDGIRFQTPAAFYGDTLVSYTYGKTLLAPGARIGYIAVTPGAHDREGMKEMLLAGQLASGWSFPDNVMMYAVADLERLSIDVAAMQARRDRMVDALTGFGYELHVPEGTFYLVVRCPVEDEAGFCDRLASLGILVMPGSVFELPGYFRISLTASDEMVERSLPGFQAAMEAAGERDA